MKHLHKIKFMEFQIYNQNSRNSHTTSYDYLVFYLSKHYEDLKNQLKLVFRNYWTESRKLWSSNFQSRIVKTIGYRANQKSYVPIGEEHPSTEASNTEENHTFLCHGASMKQLSSAFPSHCFVLICIFFKHSTSHSEVKTHVQKHVSRTKPRKLITRWARSMRWCWKGSNCETGHLWKEEEFGDRERMRTERCSVLFPFDLFVLFFFLCYAMLCFVLSLLFSLSMSLQVRDVEHNTSEVRLANRSVL